jgi:hypothetical protein
LLRLQPARYYLERAAIDDDEAHAEEHGSRDVDVHGAAPRHVTALDGEIA